MDKINKLDFSGQTIFCGIDVHKDSWKICVRSSEMHLKTFSQPPSVNALVHFLQQNYPGAGYQAVYEASFCGFTHQRALSSAGIPCLVVNPADVPTTDKERQQKCDTIDCRKLSYSLSKGELRGIHIPDITRQNDRHLIRHYRQFLRDQTRSKNRIKSWLAFQGITIPPELDNRHWTADFLRWIGEVSLPSATARTSLNLLVDSYRQHRGQILQVTRALRALMATPVYKENYQLLCSVPGIGSVSACLLLLELGDMCRFKRLDALCSYVGLIPQTHSSGPKEQAVGLTHRGHPYLREVLIEAAWRARAKDPALTMAYLEYCKRMNANKAIIRIARKLLNRVYFVLREQTPYQSKIVVS